MAKEREIRFQDPQQLAREIRTWLASQQAQRELEQKAQQAAPRLGGRASMFERRRRRRGRR